MVTAVRTEMGFALSKPDGGELFPMEFDTPQTEILEKYELR